MKQKLHLFAVVLVLIAGTVSARSQATIVSPPESTSDISNIAVPEHPATLDQVKEYLDLVHYVENARKAMSQMIHVSRSTSAPYFTPSFWDDMEKAVLDIDIITPVIPAYQKYFSEEDMAATIAFYKTPAGQRLLEAQPFITSAAGDVLRKIGRAAGEQVGLKHKEEIETLMKKSQAPPTLNKSTQQKN